VESIPEQDIEKTGKSVKKSYKNYQGYKDIGYEERLNRYGLTILERRRSRGDLIEAYKIITGREALQSSNCSFLN